MFLGAADHTCLSPGAPTASAVAALLVEDFDRDMPRVSIPRAESHVIVRFGPSARSGLDVYAFGPQQRARRKLIGRGQRAVSARLHLGAHEAVLGTSASAITGRVVPLEDLWGRAATERLTDRLAGACDSIDAARILENAIGERLSRASGCRAPARLALDAADRLTSASVNDVASDLGVSERHLRRVFRETFGVNPKAFAKLSRFHRALSAAREDGHATWASIAAAVGYYDQAHLIAEFRVIAGVTPQALLGELRAALSGG